VLPPGDPKPDRDVTGKERRAHRAPQRDGRGQLHLLGRGLPAADDREQGQQVGPGGVRAQVDPDVVVPDGQGQPEQEGRRADAEVGLPADRVGHRHHPPVVEVHLDRVPVEPERPRLRVVQRRRPAGDR
jgi:hypothetical protein